MLLSSIWLMPFESGLFLVPPLVYSVYKLVICHTFDGDIAFTFRARMRYF